MEEIFSYLRRDIEWLEGLAHGISNGMPENSTATRAMLSHLNNMRGNLNKLKEEFEADAHELRTLLEKA